MPPATPTTYAACCHKARYQIHRRDYLYPEGAYSWLLSQDPYDMAGCESGCSPYELEIEHCPFCGHRLDSPVVMTAREFLETFPESSGKSPGKRICLDVDGVLADDTSGLPYGDRSPYPWAAALLGRLAAAGHELVYCTARYMSKCDGDQKRAHDLGHRELCEWLKRHDFPPGEVYLGKPAAEIYLDDRACRVESNRGIDSWDNLLRLLGRQE